MISVSGIVNNFNNDAKWYYVEKSFSMVIYPESFLLTKIIGLQSCKEHGPIYAIVCDFGD